MSHYMRKQGICICENKDADQKLISAFIFATRVVRSLYYLNSKFQASSHLQWLRSLDCVGPGQTTQRPVSHYEANMNKRRTDTGCNYERPTLIIKSSLKTLSVERWPPYG